MHLDFGDQYLQVVRALDPIRAQTPPDTDTNDLSTINVYAVGIPVPLLFITISYVFSHDY
jgi:hypothetical protein